MKEESVTNASATKGQHYQYTTAADINNRNPNNMLFATGRKDTGDFL